MSDATPEFMKITAAVMSDLDIAYMQADLDTQVELRDNLDRAMRNYSRTRLAILKRQVTCTVQDVEAMKKMRQNLTKVTGQRQLLDVFLGFAGFLSTRFL